MITKFKDMYNIYERFHTKMYVPDDILIFHKLFKDNGFKLFVVGGAVRDFIMGKTPHDYDLVTDAMPQESIEILKNFRTDIQGVKFGVVRVYTTSNPEGYEIASYRKDISKGRDNKGNNNKVDIGKHITVKDDVLRRDLTINALFYDLNNNQIVDIVGGINDINNNIIRTVGIPSKRFNEDRLRILRTIRFAAVTNGKIDKVTSDAIKNDNRLFNISEEDDVSRERIFAEFIKVRDKSRQNNDSHILTRFINLLIYYNILKQIFPVLVTSKNIRPTKYLSVALAQSLKDNIINDEFKRILSDAKIPNKYIDIVSFLIKLYKNGINEENVYDLYREMNSKDIRKDIIIDWYNVIGINDIKSKTFLYYQPSTTGIEVMKDGFKKNEIGEEIKRRESVKFKKMVLMNTQKNMNI